MTAYKKSRGITPLILNPGSRSGKRPVSRRVLSIFEAVDPASNEKGARTTPGRAGLITWQVNLTTLTSCSTFCSWNASYSRFELHVQKPKLNPLAFNMNRFPRIRLVALGIRRTSDNRPDLRTERVSHKHREHRAWRWRWLLFPVHKSQYLRKVRCLCEDVNTTNTENI
jgi:hypothetical protein